MGSRIIGKFIWVNYNDLTSRPKPGIMVSKGNHPQMALIQVSELLLFAQVYGNTDTLLTCDE